MTPQARLGGFKILKDVARISLDAPIQKKNFPARIFQQIAQAKINLPFISAVNDGRSWGLNIMVDSAQGATTSQIIEQEFGKILTNATESAVLSIFPHKSDPTITGSLLEVFDQEGIDPDGYANSPSAISVVLKRGIVKKAMPLSRWQKRVFCANASLHGLTIGNWAKSSGDSVSNSPASTIRGVKPLRASSWVTEKSPG